MGKIRITELQLETLKTVVKLSGKFHKPVSAKSIHESGLLIHLKLYRGYLDITLGALSKKGLLKPLSERKYTITPKGRDVVRNPSKLCIRRATKEPEDLLGICECCGRFQITVKFNGRYQCKYCLTPELPKQDIEKFAGRRYSISEELPVKIKGWRN